MIIIALAIFWFVFFSKPDLGKNWKPVFSTFKRGMIKIGLVLVSSLGALAIALGMGQLSGLHWTLPVVLGVLTGLAAIKSSKRSKTSLSPWTEFIFSRLVWLLFGGLLLGIALAVLTLCKDHVIYAPRDNSAGITISIITFLLCSAFWVSAGACLVAGIKIMIKSLTIPWRFVECVILIAFSGAAIINMVNAMMEVYWFAFSISLIASLPGGWVGAVRSADDETDEVMVLPDGRKVRRSFGNKYVDDNGKAYEKSIDGKLTPMGY